MVRIRPEDYYFAGEGPPVTFGRVTHLERLGDVSLCYVDIGAVQPLFVKVPGAGGPEVNTAVTLHARPVSYYIFDKAGARI